MPATQQIAAPSTVFRLRSGDWNAFLALLTDNLAKFVLLPVILIGTFQFTPEIVFGRILTGLSLTIFVGLLMLAYMAARLSAAEGRQSVTALPYGISTPVMFVYLFGVMGPVYFATNDPLLAYRVGLGAAFIGGLIEIAGAFFGPLIERLTPPAGMLGTVAGVAIIWIAMVPSAIIFANPVIGLPVLFITLLGLVGGYRFPFRLPTGVIALTLGVGLGLLLGDSTITFEEAGFYAPVPIVGELWLGIRLFLARPELLAVIVPIEIYNFIEAMGNVESAKADGDRFNMRNCLLVDGFGTCLGALFGSPFPTSIYIGQPAYKQMGGGTAYAVMTGLFLFVASLAGLFAFLQHLIPPAAVAPLLVFIGIVMTNYAFRAAPAAHGVAVVFALVPHIADLLKKQLDGALLEVLQQGQMTPELAVQLADHQGVYLESYGLLSQGAIITGLLWGAIVAFLIDGKLKQAMYFSLVAGLLALVGLIHAPVIGLTFSPIAWAYLLLAGLLGLLHRYQPALEQIEKEQPEAATA